MITRPPLTYTTNAQIVRLWHYGFDVPMPVYLYALSQMPQQPVIEYRTAEDGDRFEFFLERADQLTSAERKSAEWSNGR
jgi:hypothetical protein